MKLSLVEKEGFAHQAHNAPKIFCTDQLFPELCVNFVGALSKYLIRVFRNSNLSMKIKKGEILCVDFRNIRPKWTISIL